MITNLFALLETSINRDGKVRVVRKIALSQPIQDDLQDEFEEQRKVFLPHNVTVYEFNGSYKPSKEEVFCIPKFKLPPEVLDVVQKPQGASPLLLPVPEGKIKSLFAIQYRKKGNYDSILFQSFPVSRIIDKTTWTLLLAGEQFSRFNDHAMSLGKSLVAVFQDDDLYFRSYRAVGQFLDIDTYFRDATDEDIYSLFADNTSIVCDNLVTLTEHCNDKMRKQFSLIRDSDILHSLTPDKVKKALRDLHWELDVKFKGSAIIFPDNKQNIQSILTLLAEEVYNGPITQKPYFTNSKMPLDKKDKPKT